MTVKTTADMIERLLLPKLLQAPLTTPPPASSQGSDPLLIIYIVVIIPVIIALIIGIRIIYKNTIARKFETTLLEDFKKEADDYERKGKYVSAAKIYEEKLKDSKKAAALYEKGGDLKRAASLYDLMGISSKAKELYEQAGDFSDAAQVSMLEGDYEEAAKLYDKAGKKNDAAEVLVRSGRKLAAVKIYRESGEYRRAAQLLEEEGMKKEAAEMFGIALSTTQLDSRSIKDFYTYAFKLEQAGLHEKALQVYKQIDASDPTYKDVREKIHHLEGSAEKDDQSDLETLRRYIRSGGHEPKQTLKLWVQLLKYLQDSHKAGRPYGMLSPDNVVIHQDGTLSFLNKPVTSAYMPPETTKGAELDVRADIFSSGVILYEMLAGNLDGLGTTRLLDISEDVPEWLDDIVIRCMRKVREDRYQSIEDIIADLKRLSQKQKESSG